MCNLLLLNNRRRFLKYNYKSYILKFNNFYLIHVIELDKLIVLYELFGYFNVFKISFFKNFKIFKNKSIFRDNVYICFMNKALFFDYYYYMNLNNDNFFMVSICYNNYFLNFNKNLNNIDNLLYSNILFIFYFFFVLLLKFFDKIYDFIFFIKN
jgi:hypothetical protein